MALSLFFAQANAQILKPVKWSYAFKKISPTEAVVFVKATIDEGWHVYSQNVKEGGPVKTSFKFASSKSYTLVGKTTEPKPIIRMEKAFNMEVGFFEKSAIFQQKLKLIGKGPITVKGSLEYMTCDDNQCLPPEAVDFSVVVK
jgi:hypothetical protein